jgi:hypothetical protein
MKKVLTDVEVYPNCFLCSIKDFKTKQVIVWEISHRKDDRKEIVKFFKNFRKFLIHFNGVHYDVPIILWVIENEIRTSIEDWLWKLKQWSDYIINNDFWWSNNDLKKYKYHNLWTDVDLFLYWSKSLRQSKKISLKGLAIQLGYPVVQELPFDPDMHLDSDQIDELIHYNSIHDLGILELLTTQFEGKGTIPLGNLGTIQLRGKVKSKYKLNAFSWDAPKLASEVMIYEYCKRTGITVKEFKSRRFERKSFQFRELFAGQSFNFKTSLFISVYNEWMNSRDSFSKEFVAFSKNKEKSIKISVGVGGIHNILKNKIYESDDEYDLIDIDIESLYPTFILELHCFRFKELEETYSDFKTLRVTESKPNVKKYKGTDKEQYWKDEDSFYKVILNGLSGHLDQEHSPLYNNIGAMKMRCMGQLVLLTITETLLQENIEVIQINTDGLTVKIHKSKIDWFKSVVSNSEKEFNVKFEYGYYKKMVLLNVNSYLAIDTDGKVKQKNDFVVNPELGNSVNFLIIPKALNAYYTENKQPEEFIKNHKEIYDFCASKKVDRSYTVTWTNPEGVTLKQQRLNRFYASTRGGYLYKNRDGSSSHLLKDSGVMIYNKYTEKFPDDINYNFYITQVRSIITELNNNNQLTLF